MLKHIKYIILTFIISLCFSQNIHAQCVDKPSCQSLGYIYSSAECGSNRKVKCPFEDKYFCNYCEINGYTNFDNCKDGQTQENCPKDGELKKCTGEACLSGYSSMPKACLPTECLKHQNDNFKCSKCIDAGLPTDYNIKDPEVALCAAIANSGVANRIICNKDSTNMCGSAIKGYQIVNSSSCQYGWSVFERNICSTMIHRANNLYGQNAATFCRERGYSSIIISQCPGLK